MKWYSSEIIVVLLISVIQSKKCSWFEIYPTWGLILVLIWILNVLYLIHSHIVHRPIGLHGATGGFQLSCFALEHLALEDRQANYDTLWRLVPITRHALCFAPHKINILTETQRVIFCFEDICIISLWFPWIPIMRLTHPPTSPTSGSPKDQRSLGASVISWGRLTVWLKVWDTGLEWRLWKNPTPVQLQRDPDHWPLSWSLNPWYWSTGSK